MHSALRWCADTVWLMRVQIMMLVLFFLSWKIVMIMDIGKKKKKRRQVGALHHRDNGVTVSRSGWGHYIQQQNIWFFPRIFSTPRALWLLLQQRQTLGFSARADRQVFSDSMKEWFYLCLVLLWNWWAGSGIITVLRTWQSMQNGRGVQSQFGFFYVTDCVCFFFPLSSSCCLFSQMHTCRVAHYMRSVGRIYIH